MVRIARYAAGVLLLAVLAAGCEDEPEPNIPSASPTPTETESSPSTSPTPEPETAEAFIERWNRASTEMQNSGESEDYRSMTSNCDPCARLADTVDEFYAAGGYIKTAGRTVTSAQEVGGRDHFLAFEVAMTSAPTKYKESASGETKTLPGGQSVYRVEVKRINGQWEIWHYVRLPK